MKDPRFLTLDEVLAIHSDQVRQYGGSGGIRDVGLLSSALAMPRASFGGQYLHPSLHEMAAACLFHLVQNHPFIDGNERISHSAQDTFPSQFKSRQASGTSPSRASCTARIPLKRKRRTGAPRMISASARGFSSRSGSSGLPASPARRGRGSRAGPPR